MNRQVSAVAGRLSLRPPQRESLRILDRVTELVALRKGVDLEAALAAIRGEFPGVVDFERDFPSLCFALATGVGKTRLMGAFVAYLHLAHGLNNFFILAPNLTIYRKLIEDFRPGSGKYVFTGIAEFAIDPPAIITGDNYEQGMGVRRGRLPGLDVGVQINIFNISKINSEVRGGKSPKIKRLSEYLGESYFEYLAGLPDLVLLMDESHRYRASSGVRAINELKPVLGLELTATPFVETARGGVPFRNVIYEYSLGTAMRDGFVKEPAVVTRKNFSVAGMSPDEIERIKLEDGIRLHETVKADLDTYTREMGERFVKPFVLVIARDTTHAARLLEQVESPQFFGGSYTGKAIQVDSSMTGAEEDKMIENLLNVERSDNPVEIVIHVNMLKEGWDVTNLYTIIPLRAANAKILIEQSIGRGLRLPYGKRTGVASVDRLNIVAHDKFQEIVDEANRPGSAVRMATVYLDATGSEPRMVTVLSHSLLEDALGLGKDPLPEALVEVDVEGLDAPVAPPLVVQTVAAFPRPADQQVAQTTYAVIKDWSRDVVLLPSVTYLREPDLQARLVREVASRLRPSQLALGELSAVPDIGAIVGETSALMEGKTIDIPRILVVPVGESRGGYLPFTLDLSAYRYPTPHNEMWLNYLSTGASVSVGLASGGGIEEAHLEDYLVGGLIDYDDVSYDDHSELLYDLAGQAVSHFRGYLGDAEIHKVFGVYRGPITKAIHAQMRAHYSADAVMYETRISKGFTALRASVYTARAGEATRDYRLMPDDKSNMAKYLFGGFARCLYGVQKFDSDPERRLAVILERNSLKWFRPARGQFQLFYRDGLDHSEYQPDFVAEDRDTVYMLEAKAANRMNDPDVVAKRDVAVEWCRSASEHARGYGGKPWRYALIPHDMIQDNMTLSGLVARFGVA